MVMGPTPPGTGVRAGPGVAALLDELGVTLLLQRLPGHLLRHVRTLLPSGGRALAGGDIGALLVILVPGHCDRDGPAHLLEDLIADLSGRVDVITDLRKSE